MDQQTFISLVEPFQNRLFRIAKRLLVSREEAEDAAQEVMVRLWTKKSELQSYQSVEALAVRMTKNYCLDQLKAKRSSNLRIDDTYNLQPGGHLEKEIEARDQLAQVEQCLQALPEQQRMIVHLREIEHLEYDQIAQIMEMNEAAVRVNLSRARKKLRELMLVKNQMI